MDLPNGPPGVGPWPLPLGTCEAVHLPTRPTTRSLSGRADVKGGATMRPSKIILLVVGVLVGLMGLGMAGGGAALMVLAGTQRDAAGYLTTSPQQYSTTTYALTAHVPVVAPDGASWAHRVATVRIMATDAGQGA